jgi:hypothetical protein
MLVTTQLTQTTRVTRSRHTGEPVLQTLNTEYGYYSGGRKLSEEEAAKLAAQPPYTGEKHPAEVEYEKHSNSF